MLSYTELFKKRFSVLILKNFKNKTMKKRFTISVWILSSSLVVNACQQKPDQQQTSVASDSTTVNTKFLSQPLIKKIYTADPSARVFNNRIYIYPSHDVDAGTKENDNGDHFDMRDYHIFSMDSIGGEVTDHGVGLDLKDIPWAGRQLWAPDAIYKNGKYFLYFPVKDKNDVFRIGVATSRFPEGPFKAMSKPIDESLSIDPAVFTDNDGKSYLYFGGIWGGQLQRWKDGKYDANGSKTDNGNDSSPALSAKVARLSDNMVGFEGAISDVKIVDKGGKELLTGDHSRRFFEGAYMHRYNNKYYFTYSTGDTHFLAYAIGESPLGPFVYQGTFMNPVQGWTTHHSIIEHKGKWWIFYHDTQLSGKTHLRNIKVTELHHEHDGSLLLIKPILK
jgi:hypothetical protein